jgi:hypothetical protein
MDSTAVEYLTVWVAVSCYGACRARQEIYEKRRLYVKYQAQIHGSKRSNQRISLGYCYTSDLHLQLILILSGIYQEL